MFLYGTIGTQQFTALYRELWALRDNITLCVRHHYDDNDTAGVRLSGYGVQLAVKSTEYKAVDDTRVKEGVRVCVCVSM